MAYIQLDLLLGEGGDSASRATAAGKRCVFEVEDATLQRLPTGGLKKLSAGFDVGL